ncbi:uncharacterized protein I206_104105 [Kwoniella pini CBS 10737]|uniref:GRF-type domain-containing protein n=1 Tax=Kwoniella pini CBS 10737 TaxID=1296096 RepID=A0A1B9I2M2_9TREE|nr:uncharacterized protein I206_04319 [Kwoniella pini CBS 10737]OCF49792.1 hypothetical protein I206_04319 [Kwoniella pini CBS 10737]
MSTRTRTTGGSRVQNPTRTQLQPSTPVDEAGDVQCTGHQMKCPKLRAGPKTKNAGRAFYCCPLPRDDPNRCKFFKWHDEISPLDSNRPGPSTPSGSTRASQLVERTNQTLGQSPAARYGRPFGSGPSTTSTSPLKTSSTRIQEPVIVDDDDEDEDEMEEIDWDKVDAENLERDAIASTPASSQHTASQQTPNSASLGGVISFADRLMNAADDGLGKRRREDDSTEVDRTPKRSANDPNPFLSSPTTPRSPPHSVLSPTISSLEQISEHLHRQDRLLRAAEQMKKGMRTTIKSLQDKNKELEDKVRELENRLGD